VFRYELSNTSDQVLMGSLMNISVPLPVSSAQDLVSVTSNLEFTQQDDALGNRILSFSFDSLPPYGKKIVSTLNIRAA